MDKSGKEQQQPNENEELTSEVSIKNMKKDFIDNYGVKLKMPACYIYDARCRKYGDEEFIIQAMC